MECSADFTVYPLAIGPWAAELLHGFPIIHASDSQSDSVTPIYYIGWRETLIL